MSESPASPDLYDLVVVGASAGGVEALSVLLESLPADFRAPVVIAQHLDPTRPSQLDTILQRVTPLAVVRVEGRHALAPGTVYVVPANNHVTIGDGVVALEGDHQGRSRPSIALLLSTAASIYGERLIAVILTGAGSDGAAGAVAVKQAGGVVIIQDPATARFPSMPLALPPTAIDHVANTEQIGPLLHDLVTGAYVPAPSEHSDGTLKTILELVNRQANIDFSAYKASTIIRRIGRRMAATHTQSMRDYATYLRAHPEEIGELVAASLINVTHFFRDPEAFEYLRNDLLPQLIERERYHDRTLRLWSAGCATGEEPYSLAMLLTDMLGAELPEWSIKIFATDLDAAAIHFARTGVYPENALDGLPDGFAERFFECVDQRGCQINKTLRQMVVFGLQDLGRSPPFPRIDLALCRNVLIYFTPELQERVMGQLAYSLRQRQGYLMLGKAETVRPKLSFYEAVNKSLRVYRCVADDQLSPQTRGFGAGQAGLAGVPSKRRASQPGMPSREEAARTVPELNHHRRLNDMLLRFLPIGVVLVDRSYRIISVNAAARRLLGLREGTTEQDFLHATRGMPYEETRAAIDTVFRQRSVLTLPEVVMNGAADGRDYALSLSFVHMQIEPDSDELVAISITDVTEQVQTRRRLEVAQRDQTDLLGELESTNQRLNQMNKDLVDANEQLQVANEELMLTQEELQATVEEFETTNEELQAANEELETSNEELQATNEELETTNEELLASMAEQQALAHLLSDERKRVVSLMQMAPFYIIACEGPELIVDHIDRRFELSAPHVEVIGRSLAEVVQQLWSDADPILSLARRAYQTNTVSMSPRLRLVHRTPDGRREELYYVCTFVPRRGDDGQATGMVIYVADETLQQQRLAAVERDRLKLIFEHAPQVALALYDARTTELLVASPRYLELVRGVRQIDTEDATGRHWNDLAICVPQNQTAQVWEQVLSSGEPFHLDEVRLRLSEADDESIWDWHVAPLMSDLQPGAIQYVLISAVEVSAQVRIREEIQRLDQLKDEFLTSASHELRTPMTTLTGYLHVLRQTTSRPPAERAPAYDQRIADILGILQKQVTRLTRLISDLVDVSRLQTGKLTLEMQPVDLAHLVEQAVQDARVVKAEPPIQLSLPDDDSCPVVRADPDRLLQVVLNLLQNALFHAPDSERIDVRLCCTMDETSGESLARIEVQDYGPGIDHADQDMIFDRLRQVSQNNHRARTGLGLGLYISRQLIEQHGGSIAVDSEPGKGSTFAILLPLAAPSG